MSAVEELAVILEHDIDEQYQYQPGEVVRGAIRVKVVRPTAIRSVSIRVVGEGTVSWKDAEEEGEILQAEEKYLDASQTVLDTRGGAPRNLPPGYHQFPFQYRLLPDLPSSYIGKFGNVTYTMKATVTGVKAIDTAITSEPFLVLRRSALPPSALDPLTLERGRRVWGGCWLGKVSARVSLEQRGGVPGQDLFVHAEVKNQSRRVVTAMQAALVMHSIFLARKNSTSFRQVVSKKRDDVDVENNEGRRWNYVRLTLPPYIPETHLEGCDIIDIHYLFQFRVELSGGAELKMETPILIGSHYPGQDIAKLPMEETNQNAGQRAINSRWSVSGQGFPDDSNEDQGDPDSQFHMQSGVPELRGDKVVITNPLFRQGSILRGQLTESKDAPEEQMENTRL